MKTPALAFAATLLATAAVAQTATAPGGASNAPAPGAGIVDRNTGRAAAGGNRNQAVATTNAHALQPAHGANSFSQGEARRRIESRGYASVSGLRKDGNGVWRGHATHNGNPVNVWLDYKGNIGQQGGAARAGVAAGSSQGSQGTGAARSADRTLGTNATGANTGANAPDGTRGNPPSTALGRAVDRAQGQTPQVDGTPGNPAGTALGRALGTTGGTTGGTTR